MVPPFAIWVIVASTRTTFIQFSTHIELNVAFAVVEGYSHNLGSRSSNGARFPQHRQGTFFICVGDRHLDLLCVDFGVWNRFQRQ